MAATLFWHDYETFGADPKRDFPVQFGGIRTDLAFNIIGQPVTWYCRPPLDYLPDPQACAVTGITPYEAQSKGVNEIEFARLIHDELAQPDTCTVGYNNLRFDDEVTRHLLYRQFYDPYTREYQHNNSRWDLLDVLRMAYALRPEGIQWPAKVKDNVSVPSFRLEDLTQANGIEHGQAHDALADVYATIAMARLLSEKQPKLYHFLYRLRMKAECLQWLNSQADKMFLHTTGMYAVEHACTSPVVLIGQNLHNRNQYWLYDCRQNPDELLDSSVELIKARLFTPKDQQTQERFGIKGIQMNKCPALAPISVLTQTSRERLQWQSVFEQHAQRLIKYRHELLPKLQQVFAYPEDDVPEAIGYAESRLYAGFINGQDKTLQQTICQADINQRVSAITAKPDGVFSDERYNELLFLQLGRLQRLPTALQAIWNQHVDDKLNNGINHSRTYTQYFEAIQQIQAEHPNLAKTLTNYGQEHIKKTNALFGRINPSFDSATN